MAAWRECAAEWRERTLVRVAPTADTHGRATASKKKIRIRRRDAPGIRFAPMPLARSARNPLNGPLDEPKRILPAANPNWKRNVARGAARGNL